VKRNYLARVENIESDAFRSSMLTFFNMDLFDFEKNSMLLRKYHGDFELSVNELLGGENE
jgi:hypothetical protein